MFWLLLFLTIFKFTAGDTTPSQSKYINLLPEKEKEELILGIARRIFGEIKSNSTPNTSDIEITDQQLHAQDAYVQHVIEDEAEKLRNKNGINKTAHDILTNISQNAKKSIEIYNLTQPDIKQENLTNLKILRLDSKHDKYIDLLPEKEKQGKEFIDSNITQITQISKEVQRNNLTQNDKKQERRPTPISLETKLKLTRVKDDMPVKLLYNNESSTSERATIQATNTSEPIKINISTKVNSTTFETTTASMSTSSSTYKESTLISLVTDKLSNKEVSKNLSQEHSSTEKLVIVKNETSIATSTANNDIYLGNIELPIITANVTKSKEPGEDSNNNSLSQVNKSQKISYPINVDSKKPFLINRNNTTIIRSYEVWEVDPKSSPFLKHTHKKNTHKKKEHAPPPQHSTAEKNPVENPEKKKTREQKNYTRVSIYGPEHTYFNTKDRFDTHSESVENLTQAEAEFLRNMLGGLQTSPENTKLSAQPDSEDPKSPLLVKNTHKQKDRAPPPAESGQKHYAPVYNYGPENAYFNPNDRFQPHSESVEDLTKYETELLRNMLGGHKTAHDDIKILMKPESEDPKNLKEKMKIDRAPPPAESGQKHYAPVYNYGPENAYFNTKDRFQPHSESVEDLNQAELEFLRSRPGGHKTLQEDIKILMKPDSEDPKSLKEKKKIERALPSAESEEKYYAPVYNYGPENAYFNTKDRFQPYSESVEDLNQAELEFLRSRLGGHKTSLEDIKLSTTLDPYIDLDYFTGRKEEVLLRNPDDDDSSGKSLKERIRDTRLLLYAAMPQKLELEERTVSDKHLDMNIFTPAPISHDYNNGYKNFKPKERVKEKPVVRVGRSAEDNTRNATRKPNTTIVYTDGSIDVDIDYKVLVKVCRDMINLDNDGLVHYDWLKSTIDIRAGVQQLIKIIDFYTLSDLHLKNLELLKYVYYLYVLAKEEFEKNLQSVNEGLTFDYPKPRKVTYGPQQEHKKNRRRVLDINEDLNLQVPDLFELEDLFKEILFHLHKFHEVLAKLAKSYTYGTQDWYSDIKSLYLQDATDHELGVVLLHFSVARAVELIENSNIANVGFKKYVEGHPKEVKLARNECVFVIGLLKELRPKYM